MAFNAFSLLEDIIDDDITKTIVLNKKPKETVENVQVQENQETISFYSPDQRKKYLESIIERRKYVEKHLGWFENVKEKIEGKKQWLEEEKQRKEKERKMNEEGLMRWLVWEMRRIQKMERRNIEAEKGFIAEWKRLVKVEKKYIVAWKRYIDEEKVEEEEDEEKLKMRADDRSSIQRRKVSISRDEKAIEGAEKACFERCLRWVEAEKESIKEKRRCVDAVEKRIDEEKVSLEIERKVSFALWSKEDQDSILKERKWVASQRRDIFDSERLVKEEEKWVKEEDKRFKEAEKRVEEAKKAEEKRKEERRAPLTKDEMEKDLKKAIFSHPKMGRPQLKQNIPEKMSQNLYQVKAKGRGGNFVQYRVKQTEEKQNTVEETKEKEDAEVVSVEEVKEGETLEETKSENPEGCNGKKKNKKKKLQNNFFFAKSEEETREERRKEAAMMAKMKTLQQYEEEIKKRKAESGKLKAAAEIRKVELDEEFKGMKIIGKKKETINGFLSNGIKK